MRNILACLTVALVATGCATGRIADLKDCGTLSFGVGPGLDATAKAGCLFHPSVGFVGSKTSRIGLETRELPLVWEEQQIVWPVLSLLENQVGTAWGGSGTPLISYARYCHVRPRDSTEFETCWIPALVKKRDRNPFVFHELTDIEAGATLLLISGRVGINPLEIIDFLLGFVGVDIANDDPKKEDKGLSGSHLETGN